MNPSDKNLKAIAEELLVLSEEAADGPWYGGKKGSQFKIEVEKAFYSDNKNKLWPCTNICSANSYCWSDTHKANMQFIATSRTSAPMLARCCLRLLQLVTYLSLNTSDLLRDGAIKEALEDCKRICEGKDD